MERVKYFINGDYPADESTLKVLDRMARVEGVRCPVVALPDLHYKFSYHTPTGVVVLAKDRIIPKFVNANCGMSFIRTPFHVRDLDGVRTDAVFNRLRERLSISTRLTPIISRNDLEDIVMTGAAWTYSKYGMDAGDLMNYENGGSIFKDSAMPAERVMDAIPRACRDMGLLSLGVLGYGNHFVELQAVDSVIDKDTAARFGLSDGQLCFMIHSDSRAFGQSLIDFYSGKAKKLLGLQQLYKKAHYGMLASGKVPVALKYSLDRMNFYLNRMKSTVFWKVDSAGRKADMDFEPIMWGTKEAEDYLIATYAAINFGYANRAYMAALIGDALGDAFGKAGVKVSVLHDGNHDALQKETIDGTEYFVHRNGAARAWPSSYYPGHPVFSVTGQPVLLPSSLGRPSYLLAAKSGCPASYYSACHGVGRIIDRGEAREIFKADDMFREVSGSKMRIYDYGRGKAQEESPRAFKDETKVLGTLVDAGIAGPVVKLRPLAALKGWR